MSTLVSYSHFPLLTGLVHIPSTGSYWIQSDADYNVTAKREFWDYPDVATWRPNDITRSVRENIFFSCCTTRWSIYKIIVEAPNIDGCIKLLHLIIACTMVACWLNAKSHIQNIPYFLNARKSRMRTIMQEIECCYR